MWHTLPHWAHMCQMKARLFGRNFVREPPEAESRASQENTPSRAKALCCSIKSMLCRSLADHIPVQSADEWQSIGKTFAWRAATETDKSYCVKYQYYVFTRS